MDRTKRVLKEPIIKRRRGVKIFVNSYSDPTDPKPPNNHRVEILIGTHRFVPDQVLGPDGGCTTKRRALSMLREIENELALYIRALPLDQEEDPDTLP